MAYYGRCESQQVGQLLPLISSLAPDMTYLMNEATTTSTTQAIGPDIPDTGMCIGAEATGTMSQHHTPISQPLPLVSLEPVRYERLMLYFTDKDFANNNMTADVRPKETHITTTLTSLPAVPQKAYYRRCGVEQTSQLLPPSAPPTLWGDSVQEGGGHPGGNGIQVRGGSMVLVRLCILDLTQRLPDLGRTKYNIDPARFVAVLIDRGQPPLEVSRKAPCGYWFLVAVSLSGCSRPSDKYVLAVYKYWRSNRGNLLTLLGELNDSTVTNPLEGDEIVPGPETNDVDEVEKGIIRVPEEEGDRIDALQACEKEDSLIQHGTAESTSELPLRRDDKGVKMESLQLYC
ncbi:hypothetical protein EMCRGX_G005627 [Ephydatia muelleri]